MTSMVRFNRNNNNDNILRSGSGLDSILKSPLLSSTNNNGLVNSGLTS